MKNSQQLVLGIDGGATKTVAWLARRCGASERGSKLEIVGRGTAGPANPQAAGFDAALASLDQAVDAAFEQIGENPYPAAAAVLALAGSDREENRRVLARWADRRGLARRFRIVHDALPVLAAGTPEGWGIALISGTGSFAFGQTPDGRSARCGGWGYLFGDEGSGYAIGVAALRAAARSSDGRAPPTQLTHSLLRRLNMREPRELIPAVYAIAQDRAQIAALAEAVVQTADAGDPQAQRILDDAAGELAAMVAALVARLGFSGGTYPLAVAGGVLLGSARLRRSLETRLARLDVPPAAVAEVRDPVAGAVKLACNLLDHPAE